MILYRTGFVFKRFGDNSSGEYKPDSEEFSIMNNTNQQLREEPFLLPIDDKDGATDCE